jgi:hypothetical protein
MEPYSGLVHLFAVLLADLDVINILTSHYNESIN